MQIFDSSSVFPFDTERVVAGALATGTQGNVRIIRLSPGQALPPHTHGASDLFLLVFEGTGAITVDAADGAEQPFTAGMVAHLVGTEELRVRNTGDTGMTLFAFLAPVFPPATTSGLSISKPTD